MQRWDSSSPGLPGDQLRWGLSPDDASVFMATHAAPFLDLPAIDVQYVLVSREAGRTSAEVVTDNVLGTLKRRADATGFSLAEVTQIMRAVIVVEGDHDEAVLRHFFGTELDRHRVVAMGLLLICGW